MQAKRLLDFKLDLCYTSNINKEKVMKFCVLYAALGCLMVSLSLAVAYCGGHLLLESPPWPLGTYVLVSLYMVGGICGPLLVGYLCFRACIEHGQGKYV